MVCDHCRNHPSLHQAVLYLKQMISITVRNVDIMCFDVVVGIHLLACVGGRW
jgi:hypothetical protein